MTITPEWQRERQRGFARLARLQQCKCGVQTYAGLDADVAAFEVVVDASPVDAEGEQLALKSGRRTYDMTGGASGTLWRRLDRHIASDPKYDIHVAHRCAQSEQLEIS
jgi:hypothetical protein